MKKARHALFQSCLIGWAWLMSAAAPALHAETIRVLVVYETGAKTWVDSNGGGMNTYAAHAIAKMNQAMGNSGISLTYELACATNVSYNYVNFGTDLTALTQGAGTLAVVHPWRETHLADVVVMLEDTGTAFGGTGLSWILDSSRGSPEYAYAVVAVRSIETSHTLTHEVAHLLGCAHSKYQTAQPGPNTNLNSYSAGWYFTGHDSIQYHTIMAYYTDGHGTTYTDCPLFSSPLLTYQGVVAGDAAHGDNARNIRETMGSVARYGDPNKKPNLRPYQPSGWSNKLVVSTANNLYTDRSPILPSDYLYMHWCVQNDGWANATNSFTMKFYKNGTWITSSARTSLAKRSWTTGYIELGTLSAGTYTLRIDVNATHTVDEMDETDNEYTKIIVVGTAPVPVPGAPALTAPANGATVASTNVTFSWSVPTGSPTNYHMQLSTSATFATTNYNGSSLVSTSLAMTAFPNNGTVYYWRVRARNASGWGAWSAANSFTNGTAPVPVPGAPALTAPANGATVASNTVTFSWSVPTGSPTNYHMQLSSSATFATTNYDSSSRVSNSLALVGFSNDGTVYYWRVRARNASGWGAWSATNSFTNGATPGSVPGAPALFSPANGAAKAGVAVTFSWNQPVGNPTRYHLQVSFNAGFSPVGAESDALTATSQLVGSFPNDDTLCYWRVRAYNANGWGTWSDAWYFVNVPGTASGIALSWLDGYGLPTDGSADFTHPLGKELSVHDQYIADLNPHNSNDQFEIIEMERLDQHFTLHFRSSAGRIYTLHATDNLITGPWHPVPGAGPRLGLGGEDFIGDTNHPPVGPNYRLGVALP